MEAKLAATDKEFERIRRQAKEAKDTFGAVKKKRGKLFEKAYQHISENIDKVYKELTKGKASPMGGVAYLSLEESDVGDLPHPLDFYSPCLGVTGTLLVRHQVPCDASYETLQRHGPALRR